MPTNIDIALDYCSAGLQVFPLKPRDKTPATKNGFKDASSDPETIKKLFSNPEYNIGIRCNGLLVLDVDGKEGRTSLNSIQVVNEELAHTWIVMTGGGTPEKPKDQGLQYIYRVDESLNIRPGAGKYGYEGIDIRANDSYIVAAGSTTRCEYKTVAGDFYEITEAPEWLIKFALAGMKKDPIKPLKQGSRHNQLISYIGTLRAKGISEPEILTMAIALNATSTEPLPDKEVKSMVEQYAHQSKAEELLLDDIGNSERLIKRYGSIIHYVADRRIWQIYDGKVWKDDISGKVVEYAKETARAILAEAAGIDDEKKREATIKHAKASCSNSKIKAMIELAQSSLAVTVEQLNKDIYALNVRNGTIDLRTGRLMPHNPRDLLTTIIDIDYLPGKRSEVWEEFLSTIFQGCTNIINYMQVSLGYALTGSQIEQTFQFWYGPQGSNGKSTLSGIIKDIMGEYAGEIDPIHFMVTRNNNGTGPNEALAGLYNKRAVFSTEIQDGMTLSVALVKRMRGGESIHFERKFEHGFDAEPTYKLFLSGNHEPRITDTTNSTWRSLKKIPFNYCVPDDKRDKNIRERMVKEHGEAVLAWLVAGCVRWYNTGLIDPPEIREATQAYRANEDILHEYLDENVVYEAGASVVGKELYNDYVKWSGDNSNGKPLGKKEFNRRLEEKGFKQQPGSRNRYTWYNLRLSTDFEKYESVKKDKNVNHFQESSQEKSRVYKNFPEKTNFFNKINTSGEIPDCICGDNNWSYEPDGSLRCLTCGEIVAEVAQ